VTLKLHSVLDHFNERPKYCLAFGLFATFYVLLIIYYKDLYEKLPVAHYEGSCGNKSKAKPRPETKGTKAREKGRKIRQPKRFN